MYEFKNHSLFTDYDTDLFKSGKYFRAYEKFGSHLIEVDGSQGVYFAVWAPNARSVSVVGHFNGWDRRTHAMRKHIPSGIWELFIPELPVGTLYKFSVKARGGYVVEKCDPYGFAAEVPPRTANIVANLDTHQWGDQDWMANRGTVAELLGTARTYMQPRRFLQCSIY